MNLHTIISSVNDLRRHDWWLIGICAVAVAALGVTFWAVFWRRALSFYDLTDDEQEEYVDLVNKVNALLTRNYLKRLPVRIVMAFFTLGIGLMLSSMAYSFAAQENREAKREARRYVRRLRGYYGKARIAWRTFPGANIILLRFKLPRSGQRCPVCGRWRLRRQRAGRRLIMHCRHCGKTLIVENAGGGGTAWEILAPGLLSHSISYSGSIDNLGDLGHSLSDAFDSLFELGGCLDFF